MSVIAVWNSLNASARPKTKEINSGQILTVPDLTMTIQEILERHTRGLSFIDGRVPVYQEESDDNIYPDTSRMDLAELEEYKKSNEEYIHELRKKASNEKSEAAKKRADKAKPVSTSDSNKAENDNGDNAGGDKAKAGTESDS